MNEMVEPLPLPVPRYHRVIAYRECPMCEKPVDGYRTTTEYIEGGMEVASRRRVFSPCDCTAERTKDDE